MNNKHQDEYITIGKYYIEWGDMGSLIIEIDGEGGEFKESALEEVIKKFYDENF